MLTWLLLPPVAALIGWFTNFVAVRMIFRPRDPIGVPGLKIQGLLPKRRREFAESIGATVHHHLVSSDDIKGYLNEPAVREQMEGLLVDRLDHFIQDKIIGSNPMLGAFLKGPFVDTLKAGMVAEFQEVLDQGVDILGDHLDQNLDLAAIVTEKIMEFDFDQLEAIVLDVAKKELHAIEILGAVLGFIVGLVQVGLLAVMT